MIIYDDSYWGSLECLSCTLRWLSTHERMCLVCVENCCGALADLQAGKRFADLDLDIEKVLCPTCEKLYHEKVEKETQQLNRELMQMLKPRKPKISGYDAKISTS